MENKSTDATGHRPEGERMLNAPLIATDINKLIAQLCSEPEWKTNDRNSITIFKSDVLRIVLIGLHEGADLKPHKAPGTISVQVIEGLMKFNANGQTSTLEKGQMIVLHENIEHSVLAVNVTFFLLTMSMK